MTRRRARIALLAAICGATVGLALAAPAAQAETLPLTYDLGVVMPGASASVTRDVEVPMRSTVAAASFGADDADAAWTAHLCGPSGACHAVGDLAGTTLDAGDYRLVVEVTMPAEAATDATANVASTGAITLVPDATAPSDGTLPATGGTVPTAAAVIGAALAGGGALLLLGARRRRNRTEETP